MARFGAPAVAQRALSVAAAGGEAVGEVGAGQMLALRAACASTASIRSQVGGARLAAALAHAFGDFGDNGVQRTHAINSGMAIASA